MRQRVQAFSFLPRNLQPPSMADSFADTITEEREELMISPTGGNPTLRIAHFLKPTFTSMEDLPPPSFSPKPTFSKLRKHNIKLELCKRSPTEKWKMWVSRLMPKYQHIWMEAGIYQAILASTYEISNDKKLILGLAEKWCAETNTFIFPWGEVTITLEDMIILGDYSVLGASILSPLTKDLIEVFSSMRKSHNEIRLGDSRNVSSNAWMDYYMASSNLLEHEAFLALWLSRFVLIGSYDYIPVLIFPVAIHLSRGTRIALAPAVLASIYRDMSLLKSSMIKSVEIGDKGSNVGLRFLCHAPMDLVQFWAWERFSEFRPIPNVMICGEPRSARWHNVKQLAVKDVRVALDSAGECFLWRPYAAISTNCIFDKLYRENEQWVLIESNVGIELESFARCLRVSELVGVDCIEQYLPHRVAMQFGLDQDLPPYVTRTNETFETAWSNYNRPIIRGVKLYIPPQLFESDVSTRYIDWWRDWVSVSEDGTNCIQNQNHSKNQIIPLVDSWEYKRDGNFLVKPVSPSRCVMAEPVDYVEEDNLANAKLLNLKSKSNRFGKRRVVDDDKSGLRTFSRRFSVASDGTSRKLESMMKPVKLSMQCRSFFDKYMQSISFTEGPIEPAEDAAVSQTNCPLVNIFKIEEECSEYNTTEVPELELEARIRKLEIIVDGIKAQKFATSSREKLGKYV